MPYQHSSFYPLSIKHNKAVMLSGVSEEAFEGMRKDGKRFVEAVEFQIITCYIETRNFMDEEDMGEETRMQRSSPILFVIVIFVVTLACNLTTVPVSTLAALTPPPAAYPTVTVAVAPTSMPAVTASVAPTYLPTMTAGILLTGVPTDISTTQEPNLPGFPWPVPQPSTWINLTLGSVGKLAGAGATFAGVDNRISDALTATGYDSWSYYGAPNGFVIVTRLEQIDLYGYPLQSDRWAASLAPISLNEFSLNDYLTALFRAPKGYYRVFVFVVTSDLVISSGTPVTQATAMSWTSSGGAIALPASMKALPFTSSHRCTAYVYEFIQSGMGEKANQNIPSTISARQHLMAAGLWDALEKK